MAKRKTAAGKGSNGGGTAVAEKPPEQARYLPDGFPNPKAMDVWGYMQALTEEQWGSHMAYLYRTQPRIARSSDKPGYLEKFVGAVTLDDIRDEWGGLTYTIILKRDQEKVYETRFSIEAPPKFKHGEMPENVPATTEPPAVDPAALTDAALLPVLERLLSDALAQRDKAQEEGREFNPRDVVAEAMSLQSEASKQAISFMAEQMRAATKGGGGVDDMVKMIGVLQTLGLVGQREEKSELDQIDKVLGIMDKLGHRGGGGESVWVELARSMGPNLPTVVSNLAGSIENLAKISANNLQRAGMEKGVKVAPAQPRPAVPAVEGAAPPEPAGAVPPTETPPAATDPNQVEAESIAKFFKRKIVQYIEEGATGAECADWLDEADPTFATHLCQVLQTNPEKLGTDPILSKITQNARTLEFCREYVARIIELAAEDSQPETSTP